MQGDWDFSADAFPASQDKVAWLASLRRIGLDAEIAPSVEPFHGVMHWRMSRQGVGAVRIGSSPQTLRWTEESDALWLVLPIQGQSRAVIDGGRAKVAPGEMLFGRQAKSDLLAFEQDFSLLLISIPRALLDWRTLTANLPLLARVSTRRASVPVIRAMLFGLAEQLDVLVGDDLRPAEAALLEFLVGVLAEQAGSGTKPRLSRSHTASLRRVCRTIEQRLAEPDLTLDDLAAEEGVSVRFLQKLFETAGMSFGQYLKRRRLDRARVELADPSWAHLTIAEVCFRWGFNDTAHFSRSFRQQFAETPVEHRRRHLEQQPQPPADDLHRGWPQGIATRPPDPPAAQPPWEERFWSLAPARSNQSVARHHLRADASTIHWGFFSRSLEPVLEIEPGDLVTVETLTQHAYDDHHRMISCDPGAEDVFHWTKDKKNVDRRGAGPMDASIFGRGAGEGFGVHICTGPVAVRGAEPGDVLEVRIVDIALRPSADPAFSGRTFGSNAAAWWGFHFKDLLTKPARREVVTIFEVDGTDEGCTATPVYSFRWTPQTDPFGVVHELMDYPGVPIDRSTIEEQPAFLKGVKIPVRPHFGVMAVAPREAGLVDSVPPAYFGGNFDNWRAGKGAKLFLPISVAGGLLSIGDPHASQGDGEVNGTAIECSLTGTFQVLLHKRKDLEGSVCEDLGAPLLETEREWILHGFSHPNYLTEFGENARSEVYAKSSLDAAMLDAFRKARRFLMAHKRLSEDEALALMSVAVDFGVTQLVDGNLGIHAIIRKALFQDRR